MWWISSVSICSPASARSSGFSASSSGPAVGVERLALVLVGVPDALDRLVGPGPEGGAQRLVGVQHPAALLDDRDAVIEVRHHQVELLGAYGEDCLGLLELDHGAQHLAATEADRHPE